jgi:hypothetical protein
MIYDYDLHDLKDYHDFAEEEEYFFYILEG